MPTQIQIQNTILSARYQMATLCLVNLAQMQVGDNEVKWAKIRQYKRNIKALQYQYLLQDYTSSNTLVLYNCLNTLIGIDNTVNTIDPDYQIPSTTIIIENPGAYVPPIDITWADMQTTDSPDGGITRVLYTNTMLKGLNPQLWLVSPMATRLFAGQDYNIVPNGGFELILTSGSNCQGIVDGQILTATGYETA